MIRSKLQQFMQGRYGNDQLNQTLVVVYLVLYLLSMLFDSSILSTLSLMAMFTALVRLLSRNHAQRRKENAAFMKRARPLVGWCNTKRCMMTDREHRYFKCPNCGQQLRVPRGRGNITVSCRSCGNRFKEKS